MKKTVITIQKAWASVSENMDKRQKSRKEKS